MIRDACLSCERDRRDGTRRHNLAAACLTIQASTEFVFRTHVFVDVTTSAQKERALLGMCRTVLAGTEFKFLPRHITRQLGARVGSWWWLLRAIEL